MKALGIAFSARKRGNCLNSIEYVLAELNRQGFETEIVNAYDYRIEPCSHCNYECFGHELRGKNEECPIQDDVPRIYSKMKKAGIIILAIPTYGGKPASLYSAFAERSQGIIKSYEEFKNTILKKIIALIVVGNVPAGGDLAYHTVVQDHRDCRYAPPALLLQAAEHNQSSVKGTLIEDQRVKGRLDSLVELTLNAWKTKKRNSRTDQ